MNKIQIIKSISLAKDLDTQNKCIENQLKDVIGKANLGSPKIKSSKKSYLPYANINIPEHN